MRKSFKRVLSIALAFIMLALMIPTGVFSVAAADVQQINVYIGSYLPEGEEGELFATFAAANKKYDFGTADGAYYNIYIVEDITETEDWEINFRDEATIQSYGDVATITLNIEKATKYSAWFMLGGATTVEFKNVNVTVAETHVDNDSVFALGANTSLILDTINVVTPAKVNNGGTTLSAWTIQMRSQVAKALTFKGECSFIKNGSADNKWLGGWQTRTEGAKAYTVNFDGATISAPVIIENPTGSTGIINVNVTNGSKITATTGVIFGNYGGGAINVTASSAAGATGTARTTFTCNSTSARMFYANSSSSTTGMGDITVNLDNVKINAGENTFHTRGNGTAEDHVNLTGIVKNSEIDGKAGYLIRAEGTSAYANLDLVFDNCTVKSTNATALVAYGAVDVTARVEFINGGSATTGGRLVHNSGERADITLVLSQNTTITKTNTAKNTLYSSQANSKVTLIYDNWTIVDSNAPFTHATTADGSKFYYNCPLNFTFGYRNSTGTVASSDIFNDLAIALAKPTTYGTYLENCEITATAKRLFLISGANAATTYNIDIINTTINTSHNNLFVNRKNAFGNTWNVNIVNSTINSTTDSVNNAIFYFNTHVYESGKIKTSNYPIKMLNATIDGSTFDAKSGYVFNLDNDGDTATGKHSDANIVINNSTLNSTKRSLLSVAGDADDVVNVTINNATLDMAAPADNTVSAVWFSGKTTLNMYSGSVTSTSTKPVVHASGADAVFNLYGGDLMNKNTGSNSDAFAVRVQNSTFNMYDGYLETNSSNSGCMALRSEVTGAAYIYGGTITSKGAAAALAIGTTSATGTLIIYGGTFIKEKTNGANLMFWNGGTGTSAKQFAAYGGTFLSNSTSERAIWQYDQYSSAVNASGEALWTGNCLGELNRALLKGDALYDSTTSANKITVAGYTTAYRIESNKAIAVDAYMDDAFVQIESGITTESDVADVRFIFEVKNSLADNDQYVEIGYFISLTDATPMLGEANVTQAADAKNILYTAVKSKGDVLFASDDPNYSLAILTIEDITSDYFLGEGANIYITIYVKTASGVYYCHTVDPFNVATICKGDIAVAS